MDLPCDWSQSWNWGQKTVACLMVKYAPGWWEGSTNCWAKAAKGLFTSIDSSLDSKQSEGMNCPVQHLGKSEENSTGQEGWC